MGDGLVDQRSEVGVRVVGTAASTAIMAPTTAPAMVRTAKSSGRRPARAAIAPARNCMAWRTGRASPRAAWAPTGRARPAPVARLAVQRTYARTAPRTWRAGLPALTVNWRAKLPRKATISVGAGQRVRMYRTDAVGEPVAVFAGLDADRHARTRILAHLGEQLQARSGEGRTRNGGSAGDCPHCVVRHRGFLHQPGRASSVVVIAVVQAMSLKDIQHIGN
jgi:hypothetical protein